MTQELAPVATPNPPTSQDVPQEKGLWSRLQPNQQFSLVFLVAILILAPIVGWVVLQETQTRSRASEGTTPVTPITSPIASPTPIKPKACKPRPPCLDAKPRKCKIAEPPEGWCANGSIQPRPTSKPNL